jgi:pimeloyl-ACP methyl ester carboxylesterase
MDGEAVFLREKNQSLNKFLTIYTKAEVSDKNNKGTIIILHGRGLHPNWQDLVQPLRVGLLTTGYNTLAIQLPVLKKDAKYYDYVPIMKKAIPRINAAVDFAKQVTTKKDSKIILIAHSCGAHMAMSWIRDTIKNKQALPIDAYIGLGMGATDYKQPMVEPFVLNKIKAPILDVYGENDFNAVIKMAKQRWLQIVEAGNKKSKQKVLTGANHYYQDKGDEITRLISQWIASL